MTVFSTSEKKREEALKVLKADHFIVSKDEEQMKVGPHNNLYLLIPCRGVYIYLMEPWLGMIHFKRDQAAAGHLIDPPCA